MRMTYGYVKLDGEPRKCGLKASLIEEVPVLTVFCKNFLQTDSAKIPNTKKKLKKKFFFHLIVNFRVIGVVTKITT